MTLERLSQGFKDISMSFKYNPLSGDLIGLKNENAIARSVRNIILTNPGEKVFDPFSVHFNLISTILLVVGGCLSLYRRSYEK